MYLFGETECGGGRGREPEREKISSRLCRASPEPDAGLDPMKL